VFASVHNKARDLEQAADIIAPIATVIAAIMTAANLGPRITGYGFVVFTIGSIAWCIVGFSSGQTHLLLTNGFLAFVNLVGIWRWLGRIAKFDEGAKTAEAKSAEHAQPTLLSVGNIVDRPIAGRSGDKIATAVGLMAEADQGRLAYVIMGYGGLAGAGEKLVAAPWSEFSFCDDMLCVDFDADDLDRLPSVDPAAWPTMTPAMAGWV